MSKLASLDMEWQRLLGIIKRKKMVQNDKKFCQSHLISREPYTTWPSFMVHMYKRAIYLAIFSFFQNFNFLCCYFGWKGKNWPKMTKKLSLLHSISQEAYIIWSWFLVHICKMMKSPGAFSFFSTFWFSRLLGGGEGGGGSKREKNGPKWQKILFVSLPISGIVYHMIMTFGTYEQNDDISSNFFIFSKFKFCGFLGGKRAKTDPKLQISVHHPLYLRNCRSYHQDYWYTGVK